MIDTTILDRIKILNPDYAKLIKSDFADKAAERFRDILKLNPSQTAALSNGISLYLLAFISLDELVTFISRECELSVDESTLVASAILSALPEDFDTQHQAALGELRPTESPIEPPTTTTTPVSTPVPTPAPTPVPKPPVVQPEISKEIAETESALKAIPHIRTMARDIDANKDNTPTYSSSQDSILKR